MSMQMRHVVERVLVCDTGRAGTVAFNTCTRTKINNNIRVE